MAAEVATAGVSAVASKVAESFYDSIQRQISYVFKYKSYGEELRTQVEDLEGKRQRVEQAVEDAERDGEEIYRDVLRCQEKMNELIERARKYLSVYELDEDNKQQCCFNGWFMCSNLASRRKLSIEAVNMTNEAADLLKAVDNYKLNAVSHPPAPERTEFTKVVGGYQQFDSRMGVFRDVVKALKDSEFKIIGVYGMGGVGKTTLVKEVARKVKEDKLFDEVVMAEVTQFPDVKTVQDKIAFDLGIKFENENKFERAAKLLQILKKKKRPLVILDNIWYKLDLEAVGIPCGVDDRMQCTILLTSRNQHVLSNQMNSKKNFLIGVLSEDEAMHLFWKTVDDRSTETTSVFQPLAVDIVEKCGGLPIAIKTVAAALKNNESLSVWRDALYQLSNANPTDIDGMDVAVFSSIKLSYKLLENEDAKSLFQLCGLSPSAAIYINDLVNYGIGFRLFRNVYYSMEAGRDRVYNLIKILKDSCLLLDGDTEDEVKMHDIIHAVAVSIAADSRMFIVKEVEEDGHLTETLQNVKQKNPTAISLLHTGIKRLPERLECPNLKLFMLYETDRPLEIPDLFFDGMVELRVLDLAGFRLSSLPASLGSLINLRTLCLDYLSGDIDVTIVGELKKLEILSFLDGDIKQLPREIGQLTRLKRLDLSGCRRLEVIAPNVISKLSPLEELYVGDSFIQWEKGKGGSNANVNASLVELKGLTKLTTLEIRVQHAQILPQDLVSVALKRLVISIGDGWDWYDKSVMPIALNVKGLDKNSYMGNNGMKTLLKTTEDLHLHQLNGFQNVVHELDDGEGFPLLKRLRVQDDSQISYIVNLVGVGQVACNTNIFPLLVSLFLSKLNNLEKIWHGQLRESCRSFSKLRTIEVGDCDKLKHLFSFSMAKNLLQLEEIQVRSCRSLKMIVEGDQESESTITFAQLRSLKLKFLPELTRSLGFFDLERSQRLPATSSPTSAFKEIIAEDDLEVLFNNKVQFPTLEELKLRSLSIKMIWVDHQFPAISSSLTKLTVAECSNLKFLSPHSAVKSLVNLEKLAIRGCESMERVFEDLAGLGNIRDEKQMIDSMVFPKLEQLDLSDLPKLTRFISMTESSSLSDTDTTSLFDGKVALPCLKVLRIEGLPKFRKIWQWHRQFEPDSSSSSSWSSFSNLNFLYISKCNNLMNVFPSNTITGRGFERLEDLYVWNCHSIEEIIEDEEETINSSSNFRFNGFPQLNSLELLELPKLKTSMYWSKHL